MTIRRSVRETVRSWALLICFSWFTYFCSSRHDTVMVIVDPPFLLKGASSGSVYHVDGQRNRHGVGWRSWGRQ